MSESIEVTPEVKAQLESFGVSKSRPVPTKRPRDTAGLAAIKLLADKAESGTSVEVPANKVPTWASIAKKADRKIASSKRGAKEGHAFVFIL